VKGSSTRKRKSDEADRRQNDWARFDAQTDEQIEAAIREDPNLPPLLDADWFASQADGGRLLPAQALQLMKPESITPAVEYLLSEDAPTRTIMGAGAGSFAVIKILESEGINLPPSDWTPDAVAAHFQEISDMSKAKALQGAFEQTQKYVGQAGRAMNH